MLQRCHADRVRPLSLVILAACLGLGALPAGGQVGEDGSADALLAIDQHRASVIDRIVNTWGAPLAQSSAQVAVDELRTLLEGLRADHLLAASLAGTVDGLRGVLANTVTTTATVKPSPRPVKSLGDTAIDDVYTPITPCRLVETRGTFAAVYQGDGTASHTPLPFTTNQIRTYTIQGGNNVCLSQLPANLHPSAVQLQVFGMPTTANSGDIEILPQGASFGSTATMVYIASIAFNTVSTAARVNTSNNQISVQVRGGGANVAIDVVGYFKSAADAAAMNFNVNGQRVMRYEYSATSPNVIGGHPNNNAAAAFGGQTIAGGGAAGTNCFDPLSGLNNRPCGNRTGQSFATVGGGSANLASGDHATVAGGNSNTASVGYATVAGGLDNTASAFAATVTGGYQNRASGDRATVLGGQGNTASGGLSIVAGGDCNIASGGRSFAFGFEANADRNSCVVFTLWASFLPMNCLGSDYIFRVGASHGFSVEFFSQRPDGGGNRWVYIGDIFANQSIATWTGAFLSNGGVWTNASDRNQKENFMPVDARDILARVAALPVMEWNYRSEPGVRRIGPVAQDFHAAFGVGSDDKTIATGDESGVALAAVQGLHQLMQEKDARIYAQQREIADLRERMSRLESLRSELDAVKRALSQLTAGDGRVTIRGAL